MKKVLVFLISAAMILSMAMTAGAKTYAEATDGELLYTVNFNGTEGVFTPGSTNPAINALDNHTYTVSDDGLTLTIEGVDGGGDHLLNYWGGKIEGLPANSGTSYTMVFKVRINGESGKNNSIGVGGWLLDDDTDYDSSTVHFYNNYGNYNTNDEDGASADRRTALSLSNKKIGNYVYEVYDAYEDGDGFVTMMTEFDGANATMTSYMATKSAENGYGWAELESQDMESAGESDSICFMTYAYYNCVNATISNVRYYKGTGLTAEQINYVAPVETAAPETEAPAENTATSDAPTATPSAPATADMGIVAAAAIFAIAAGVIVASKKH